MLNLFERSRSVSMINASIETIATEYGHFLDTIFCGLTALAQKLRESFRLAAPFHYFQKHRPKMV